MRQLVVSEFTTLDGVMQAPGKPDEDTGGGFADGGWQLSYFDDVFAQAVMEGFASTDALLLGRRTYEIFAAHWPNQPDDDPIAPTMNALDKYVVSRTLDRAEWANSHVVSGDVPSEVARIKQAPGKDVRVIGSGELVPMLMQHELVDRYEVMIHPLVLGGGKRLFRDGTPRTTLRLVDSTVSTTGVVMLAYAPDASAPTT
jgi:dihydrofolate reductase